MDLWVSNVEEDTGYPEDTNDFPQPLHENAGIVRRLSTTASVIILSSLLFIDNHKINKRWSHFNKTKHKSAFS